MAATESEHRIGTPIPVPPDFPVHWDDDAEPALLWSWDDFHAPLPPTPMTVSVGEFTRAGRTQANKDNGNYRPGSLSKVINGYPYSASTAPPMTDDEKSARERSLDRLIESVRANWDDQWLPELKAFLDEMKAVDYSSLSAAELWANVERVLNRHSRHWYIHNMVVTPVIGQSNRLEKICSRLLDSSGSSEKVPAHILLHGAETLTVLSINELDRLADAARNEPEVRRALERDIPSCDTRKALETSEQGRIWLHALDRYLHDFGYRCTGFDLSFPTWVEDQSFVFQVIRSMLADVESGSPANAARSKALDHERDALLEKVREAGAGRPELLEEFNRAYELGQQLWPLKEDHSHYIDQASTAVVRIAIAEVGRRLEASGAIAHADDVWYLDLDEAKAALIADTPHGIKELIAIRRADRERLSKLTPPKHMGTFPPDHDMAGNQGSATESGETLRGTAASKGQATGIARVVLSPDDFHKVRKGDVLVCRSTAPMWTPLFRVISALVSESGGILSHPAVVAREFNLPAVIGVQRATSLVVDGHPVTGAGDDGLVHTG
ncbi:MAG: PEP-utilizing enzyme [Chloroflexi bacterium]|nr:PEP-utilizing enzyme [Chloroflexota bacterium]